MTATLNHIALVSEQQVVDFSELSRTSAAIQKQVLRDLAPHWQVQATVDAFGILEDVPPGYWPVIIVKEDPRLPPSPIGGFHLDQDLQPFAVIQLTDHWPLIASHEILEMLVDPSGNSTRSADSPMDGQGRVEFLAEVCDPCEALSYTVNGISVSDFYTPHYFDPVAASGVQYSFTGAVTKPREVLQGGYLSWLDPVSGEWFQEVFFGDRPEFRRLGRLTEIGVSLRSQIDQKSRRESLEGMQSRKGALREAARSFGRKIALPSKSKAKAWRAQIEKLKAAAAGLQKKRRRPKRGRTEDGG